MVSGEGLLPSASGKRIAFDGDARTVIDGPFEHTSELVAGFWIWQVADMDEAVAWMQRCLNPTGAAGIVELRPIFEMEDFGDVCAWAGHYRQREANIGIEPIYISVHVRDAVIDATTWVEHETYEPGELAVRFHRTRLRCRRRHNARRYWRN